MREEYFAAMSDAYVMTEAEQRIVRNKLLSLRKHHVRCIHQLQWHARHGMRPSDPQFRKIEKRLRSLEKRIGAIQHRLAHARIYDDFTQPQPSFTWKDIGLLIKPFWRRLWQKRHTVQS